jgi:serine/threonine protein kinase
MTNLLSDLFTLEQSLISTRSADLYKGVERSSKETVYLWLLRHTLSPESQAAERFVDRISKIRELKLPGINILDYGVDSSGVAFAVVAPLLGSRLTYIARKPAEVDRLFESILEVIAVVHDAGLVCGDLGPGSFWVSAEGGIIWMGIMGSFDVEAQSTAAAPPIETYHFLAPEQRSGGGVSQASDVYALGVLGYLLFTGKYPIGDNKKILLGPPDPATIIPLQALQPQAPAWTLLLIPPCLSLSASKRPSNSSVLAGLVQDVRSGKAISLEEGTFAQNRGDGEAASPVIFGKTAGDLTQRDSKRHMTASEPESITPQGARSTLTKMWEEVTGSTNEPSSVSKSHWVGAGIGCALGLVIILGGAGIALNVIPSPFGSNRVNGVEGRASAIMNDGAVVSDYAGLIERFKKEISQGKSSSYYDMIQLASGLKLKKSSQIHIVEDLLLGAIDSYHGKKISSLVKEHLANNTFEISYESSLLMFNPSIDSETLNTSVEDCLAVNSPATVNLLALKALDSGKGNEWEVIFRKVAREFLKIEGAEKRPITSIVLARSAIRNFLTKEEQVKVLDTLDSSDLLWLFGNLQGEQGDIFALVSKEVVKRAAIRPPKSVLLIPFIEQHSMELKLRDGLLRAISGEIDEETVDLTSLWLNKISSDLLMAMCASAESEQVHARAFEALTSRKYDQKPADEWLTYVKKRAWEKRLDYSRVICLSMFYSNLTDDLKETVVSGISKHVNENKFITILLKSDNVELIRTAVDRLGKDFSPNLLMELLVNPDKETRIAAVKHLKWYNDLFVLRQVVESFKRERDPDVQAVYRENYWVVRQHEGKKK